MTNEEMQKAMEFIREMDARAAIKLESLTKKARGKRVAQTPSERKWKETEEGIQALLAKAKTRERKRAAERRAVLPSRSTAVDKRLNVDKRLKALADLVERQIRESRKAKKRKP